VVTLKEALKFSAEEIKNLRAELEAKIIKEKARFNLLVCKKVGSLAVIFYASLIIICYLVWIKT